MRKGKQPLPMLLVFASFWLGAGWLRGQEATQEKPHLDASAQEHIRQTIASLRKDSVWRRMLEDGETGEGVRQPWMDDMRKAGVRFVMFTYDFVWAREGGKLTDWTLVGTEYYPEYDGQPITDPNELALVRRDGLEQELDAVALPRAKVGHWVDSQPETGALGYHRICLAEDEWMPAAERSWRIGFYPPGLTPLMRAALLGDTERIEKLLGQGANVNEVTHDGSTALMWAAGGDHPAALEALLKAGARVNVTRRDGATALMAAAANDRPKDLEILLKAGADPNIRTTEGETALSIAKWRDYTDIVQLLLNAGARQ